MIYAYMDIETNAPSDWLFLSDLKKVHCVCVKIHDDGGKAADTVGFTDLSAAFSLLQSADVVVGHNIMRFDLRCLASFGFKPKAYIDTLICSRLIWPDMIEDDMRRRDYPKKLVGSHSLKAWGYRLGELKGEYGETSNAWEAYSPEMLEYCKQDVEVTFKLHQKILAQKYSQTAIDLEHRFAEVMLRQELNGFTFDAKSAHVLMSDLTQKKIDIEHQLKSMFPPKVIQLKTKQKIIPFNPASRLHIAEGLINKYGWKPDKFTDSGRAQVDEEVLSVLDYPEAKLMSEYLLVEKRLGQIANGDNAWIKLEINGKIHGRVNTNGTVTGRCSHSNPNMAQCPRVGSPYGSECRSLFTASKGKVLVGVDASGLELRCLAHYMAQYDGGAYAELVCKGDVHTENQKAAGLETRNQAKTFIYALVYGAGDAKIGKIVGGSAKKGAKLKDSFFKKFPALKRLKDTINVALKSRTYLVGLDGRKLHIRSKHLALNTLLQSAGALLVKKATILADQEFKAKGLDVRQVAHIHDEIQYECNKEIADEVGSIAVKCIEEAGRIFKFKCDLTGEYKVGATWADTH